METGVWISLTAYFLLMIAIGVYAWRKSTSNSEEYILGGRNLSPSVAALSAGASDMSGWLLLGLPGALFVSGLSQSWIGIGLTLGALLNWIIVAPRLREQTEHYDNSLTIPGFLGNRFPSTARLLRMVSAVVIVLFFAVYTASGLVGGGKLFASAFGGSYMTGVLLTLGIVLVYTAIGGFLAVSLTDFVQGCIMMLALVIMPIVILTTDGGQGMAVAADRLTAVDPDYLSMWKGVTALGWISAMAWGLGYFGQPHIIVRFMAVRSVADVPTARNIGMGWMVISLVGAIALGIFGRAYALRTGLEVSDPETIFILLANLLFHPLVTGFLYAALLAAIMSTVSSQLLVSSSSLTEDIYHMLLKRDASDRELVNIGRLTVLGVGLVAAVIASNPDSKVLGLVANAWAGFGAAFGPLILLSLTWRRMTGAGAVAGLVVGAVTVALWIGLGLNKTFMGEGLYEIVPGFVASFLAIVLVSLATPDRGEYRAR
ncbi:MULTISPECIES: sodium/proline symporter PutP [unclassified Paracoccus (in: a-proteobacteria)]|uniref:sodium/proline symporter PutP n=1 Tax=unclassified Paracoccus (in: a-proteobacteria) TaxID=2688777 RepID=UPI0012B18C3E|nr:MULTISPECIES: sodium/proline symporter PutP [unclassified Paracoccus (in: a-proteobacteria)]UXU75794.1 sodium/proline symporter PutP [Paracoccus sp. SMMA_5]UXU81703.1 sodium/proline symporter PutP [Paracoccus sp. SMMA_5_TC]